VKLIQRFNATRIVTISLGRVYASWLCRSCAWTVFCSLSLYVAFFFPSRIFAMLLIELDL
jgi:hypothetical protein